MDDPFAQVARSAEVAMGTGVAIGLALIVLGFLPRFRRRMSVLVYSGLFLAAISFCLATVPAAMGKNSVPTPSDQIRWSKDKDAKSPPLHPKPSTAP